MFLFADDPNVAEACARQFYEDALVRLQTLEPNVVIPEGSDWVPYKTINMVAKCNAIPLGVPRVIDLVELEYRIRSTSECAIFDPEEYPGLVWLDSSSDGDVKMDSAESLVNNSGDIKTLVFPSGAVVVHGSTLEKMEASIQRKLGLIRQCTRNKPLMTTVSSSEP